MSNRIQSHKNHRPTMNHIRESSRLDEAVFLEEELLRVKESNEPEFRRMLEIYTPTFDSRRLQEYSKEIGTYHGVTIFDSRHAIDEFFYHFPTLRIQDFRWILMAGMKKIREMNGLAENYYVIVSQSTGVKIPIQIRMGNRPGEGLMGVIPTTRGKNEKFNIYNDIEVFVESYHSSKKIVEQSPRLYYLREDSKIYVSHTEILID